MRSIAAHSLAVVMLGLAMAARAQVPHDRLLGGGYASPEEEARLPDAERYCAALRHRAEAVRIGIAKARDRGAVVRDEDRLRVLDDRLWRVCGD